MNTPREPLEPADPLEPEAVDELLSAELDGELEDAARGLGLSAPEALARLAATPGIDARRRAIARAHDLIATQPPFEIAVEDRLVAAAMPDDALAIVRSRRRRREQQWRVLVAAGSVAAAIAVVVGVSTMHDRVSSKSSKSLANVAAGVAGTERTQPSKHTERSAAKSLPAPVDFGDVTYNAALRAPAKRALFAIENQADSAGGARTAPAATAPALAPVPLDAPTSVAKNATGSDQFRRAVLACTTAVTQRYGIPTKPVLVGTGEVSGTPVDILIFDRPGGPIAYVVSAGDCSLVRTQPLG